MKIINGQIQSEKERNNKVFVFVFCPDNINKVEAHTKACESVRNGGYIPVTTILNKDMTIVRKEPYHIINEISECGSIAVSGQIDYDNEFFRYALDINKPIISKVNYDTK